MSDAVIQDCAEENSKEEKALRQDDAAGPGRPAKGLDDRIVSASGTRSDRVPEVALIKKSTISRYGMRFLSFVRRAM